MPNHKPTNRHFNLMITLTLFAFLAQGQNPVKTHEAVTIGGISQWIGAQGSDDTKPLLLFLHGGPGFSSKGYSKKFIKYLKDDFIVAQWDQRETGITAHWGPYKDSLTLDLFHKDTEEVVDFLLKKFSKEQLYLVGFSWGGFLGLHYANAHPEKLHAYVSVSGMIYNDESERITLEYLKEKASQEDNQEALIELNQITVPMDSWEQLYYQRKWTAVLLEESSAKKKFPRDLVQEWSTKWMPLYLEASKVDYQLAAPKIQCPIYFFLSKKDFISNYQVAEAYFKKLQAPSKEIIWFEDSTHEIPSQEPKRFSEELIGIAKSIRKE